MADVVDPATRSRALCEHLLEQIATRTGMPQRELTPAARALLASYNWPGNVRELRNALEQAGMMTDSLTLTDKDFEWILPGDGKPALPAPDGEPPGAAATDEAAAAVDALVAETPVAVRPLSQAVADLERNLIRAALSQTGGNKASTARVLGISRATLYQKLAEYQIVFDD